MWPNESLLAEFTKGHTLLLMRQPCSIKQGQPTENQFNQLNQMNFCLNLWFPRQPHRTVAPPAEDSAYGATAPRQPAPARRRASRGGGLPTAAPPGQSRGDGDGSQARDPILNWESMNLLSAAASKTVYIWDHWIFWLNAKSPV